MNHYFGAENETRTRDPNLGKVVLYQLSYFRRDLRDVNLLSKHSHLSVRVSCE